MHKFCMRTTARMYFLVVRTVDVFPADYLIVVNLLYGKMRSSNPNLFQNGDPLHTVECCV